MALVCDIKSDAVKEDDILMNEEEDLEDGEIEDDEEVSDQAAEAPAIIAPEVPPIQNVVVPNKIVPIEPKTAVEKAERDRTRERSERRGKHEEKKKRMTEAEKSILHLRKRERMQREKWKYRKEPAAETQDLLQADDFAINLEKTLASILKKDKLTSDEDKEEDKRGKKRKKRDKEHQKNKQRKIDSPKSDEIDEQEMMNIRGGSPDQKPDEPKKEQLEQSTPHSEASIETDYSSEDLNRPEEKITRNKRRDNKKNNKGKNRGRDRNYKRDRSREKRTDGLKDAQGVCVFYLQGKCQKNDCPYSHEAIPPMKLELCKFYLMDCCAKGDKCSYMHSDFPCKFYHTGLQCQQGDDCKFAHGKPLSDGLKQILFKHIETAPRDILGGFPRMSREEALNMINATQKTLIEKYGEVPKEDPCAVIPSLFDINVPVPPELMDAPNDSKNKGDKPSRSRPSRWQDPDPFEKKDSQGNLNFVNFNYNQDQDMRINSNGDIDMRTLPPHPISSIAQPLQPSLPLSMSSNVADLEPFSSRSSNVINDTDIRNTNPLSFVADIDIRQTNFDLPIVTDPRILAGKDTDIRQLPIVLPVQNLLSAPFAIDDGAAVVKPEGDETVKATDSDSRQLKFDYNVPSTLPKTQRDLYMRIQSHQKEVQQEQERPSSDTEVPEINWYSDDDDDDDNRLMIKVDNEDFKEKEEDNHHVATEAGAVSNTLSTASEVVEKLGDLSKIEISDEVTKLLSTITKSTAAITTAAAAPPVIKAPAPVKDPRKSAAVATTKAASTPPHSTDPRLSHDPRKSRRNSDVSVASEKISIYEQGSIDVDDLDLRMNSEDFKGLRPDVDLRTLQLPFKATFQNYTPATEIDASIKSHLPMFWKVFIVDVPRPDYTGLKLNINDAETTGDPRLRKIFRLSVDEKDSPASPKASPKATTTTRIDPRLKKPTSDEPTSTTMNYNQQLTTLQSSPFYHSLTSNQKLMLNQELASRTDQTGSHDPILNSLLANLNLVPGGGGASNVVQQQQQQQNNPNVVGVALNILANINKLNPNMLIGNAAASASSGGNSLLGQPPPTAILNPNQNLINQMAQSMVQPGLLGAAPGIPNLPPDFPINFDPRTNGILGNGPFRGGGGGGDQVGSNYGGGGGGYGSSGGFNSGPPGGFNNFGNDDFYGGENGGGGGGNFGPPPGRQNNNRGGDRNYNNRDRRRGRSNFNRNNGGNRNFRNRNNNRSNRSQTPP